VAVVQLALIEHNSSGTPRRRLGLLAPANFRYHPAQPEPSGQPDTFGTPSATNAAARGAPIVVLADEQDENLANWLLREGAQDVLLKPELECVPLARSLRYAIERQRKFETLRASPFLDELTGVLTPQAFFTMPGIPFSFRPYNHSVLLAASVRDLRAFGEDARRPGNTGAGFHPGRGIAATSFSSSRAGRQTGPVPFRPDLGRNDRDGR